MMMTIYLSIITDIAIKFNSNVILIKFSPTGGLRWEAWLRPGRRPGRDGPGRRDVRRVQQPGLQRGRHHQQAQQGERPLCVQPEEHQEEVHGQHPAVLQWRGSSRPGLHISQVR